MDDHADATGAILGQATAAAADLDTTGARRELLDPDKSHRWPNYRVNEIELEWRRWRVLHRLGLEPPVAASIRLFDRLAVSHGAPAAEIDPEVGERGGPMIDLTYDQIFPQGPLIMPATKGRVVRTVGEELDEEERAQQVLRSTARRRDYLRKLETAEGYWWQIGGLLTADDRRAAAVEARALPSSAGAYFSGGPEPGWDVEHDALVSKSSNAYLGAGERLVQIHESEAMRTEISRHMGRPMYPTRCTYLRYREGDYLGVHTDQPTCEVSVLFRVDGDPGPLRSYVDHTTQDPGSLDSWVLDHGHFPDGGLDFVYENGSALALTGRATPHARLPQQDNALVGALFYSGLL